MKFFRKNKESLEGKYPYDKALAFYREIVKLGTFDDGKTYMDKFRILV
jgi:WASH complex subunit 7